MLQPFHCLWGKGQAINSSRGGGGRHLGGGTKLLHSQIEGDEK